MFAGGVFVVLLAALSIAVAASQATVPGKNGLILFERQVGKPAAVHDQARRKWASADHELSTG